MKQETQNELERFRDYLREQEKKQPHDRKILPGREKVFDVC